MTTQSVFGVAGPFSVTNPLNFDNEVALVDKVSGRQLVLPAGNVITEIEIQRRGSASDPNLTAGKSIAVGVVGDARAFTGTPGALTNDLNADLENGEYVKLNDAADVLGVTRAYTTDQNVVLQCALGSSIISGSVAVILKYKGFSKSVARRHNV